MIIAKRTCVHVVHAALRVAIVLGAAKLLLGVVLFFLPLFADVFRNVRVAVFLSAAVQIREFHAILLLSRLLVFILELIRVLSSGLIAYKLIYYANPLLFIIMLTLLGASPVQFRIPEVVFVVDVFRLLRLLQIVVHWEIRRFLHKGLCIIVLNLLVQSARQV